MSFEMSVKDLPFQRRELIDGYLPLERYGLVGDGAGSALVGADGAVGWMCVPRFDSPPAFCGLLDRRRGGWFRIAPTEMVESRQWYRPDSAVLVTEMRCATGLVRLSDAFILREGADLARVESASQGEMMRTVEVLHGTVDLEVSIRPRGGATARPAAHGLAVDWMGDEPLTVSASRPLDGLSTSWSLHAGEQVAVSMRWGASADRAVSDPVTALGRTEEAWRRWARCISYDGPSPDLIRRSAITLKLLDHFESGAILAAPTSSLPEEIGGVRNWDYRYAWVRDAAFSVHAFRRIGMRHEARQFLRWILDSLDRHGEAGVLFDLDGRVPHGEDQDPDLEGYRGSAPVRWGNGAADQTQNDAYGEIVDCAWQWATNGEDQFSPELWKRIRPLIETAGEVWDTPDHGIWEIRSPGRLFTYSAAMCQVALHRGADLAHRYGLDGPAGEWSAQAAHITSVILDQSWDDQAGTLTEHVGEGGSLDASLLTLPLRHVIPADHPKMIATVDAVRERLGAGDGLIYRYDPEVSDDGLPGKEGAFLLCSSWLIDNLVLEGRRDEALELFEKLCSRAGPLGLLPEQIDPGTGLFLGNYPQAFSHVGVLSNGVLLSRHDLS
jgi:GH15 family glucan-1,4-alpha-glucosidase